MARLFLKLSIMIALVSLLAACAAPAAAPAAPAAQINPTTPALTAATDPATSASGAATAGTATAPAVTAGATSAATTASSSTSAGRTFQIVPEQSQASYQVTEKFLNRALPNQAVGTTSAIQGTLVINTTGKPTASIPKMTVDLSTLTSDQSRRDNMIRQNWLQSSQFPTATFVSTGIQGAPDSYTEGQEVSFKLLGNLTIHNTTKPATFDVKAKLAGDTVTGTATTNLLMKDFGFDPPNIAGMLSVTDGVTVTVNFTAKAAK